MLRSRKTEKKRSVSSSDQIEEEGKSIKNKASKKSTEKESLVESTESVKKKSKRRSSGARQEDEDEETRKSSRAASENRPKESGHHSHKRHRKIDLQQEDEEQDRERDMELDLDRDSDPERICRRGHRPSSIGGEQHPSSRRRRSGSGDRGLAWRLGSTQDSGLFIDLRCPHCPGQKSFSFRVSIFCNMLK